MENPSQETTDKFFADPDLSVLIERTRISDDVLEVVDLVENQHSAMLAWCLNPAEGHLQSDAVIRDFLNAAYESGQGKASHLNEEFFAQWRPSRIATTSFATAFTIREHVLPTKGRLDLLLIDRANRIVVVIENKVSATLEKEQLSSYYKSVSEKLPKRHLFKGFKFLFAVVNKKLQDMDDEAKEKLGSKWVLLDYSWLKSSATRAQLHVERNNHGAQLLMSYCRKQTRWEDPYEQETIEQAAVLAARHGPVVDYLRELRTVTTTKITAKQMKSLSGPMLDFTTQQGSVCEMLLRAQGIGTINIGVKKMLHSKGLGRGIEVGRTWLDFLSNSMRALKGPAASWPLYFEVYQKPSKSEHEAKFSISLIWRRQYLAAACAPELAEHLNADFPGLTKFPESQIRRLRLRTNLSAEEAITTLGDRIDLMEKVLASARSKGLISAIKS